MRFLRNIYLVIAFLALSSNALALEIKVTKLSDSADGACDADCSLREAINLANATPGEHSIRLDEGIYQLGIGNATSPYLFSKELEVTGRVTIAGAGRGKTLIKGIIRWIKSSWVGYPEGNSRIFIVADTASLNLRSLTLADGLMGTFDHFIRGCAIYNKGKLTLYDVRLTNNRCSDSYGDTEGGAIFNEGDLSIKWSEFIGNSLSSGDTHNAWGGAIYNSGKLLVRDTAFIDNKAVSDDVIGWGGALYNAGEADIGRSLFNHNMGQWQGAAIMNAEGAKIILSNSTLSGNTSPSWQPTTVIKNEGVMAVYNITMASNYNSDGIVNSGDLTVRNSILLGGQEEEFEYYLSSCVNIGHNYKFTSSGLLTGNSTYFYNIYGNEKSACKADILVEDAQTFKTILAPLARNGARLYTHALLPGSPAIDAGTSKCLTQDQRGFARPQDGNGDGNAVCDLGAYEVTPAPPTSE